jgi:hypothetical protein
MDRGSAVAAHGHGEPCAVSLHLNDRAAVLTADLVADFVTGWGSEAKIAGGDLA